MAATALKSLLKHFRSNRRLEFSSVSIKFTFSALIHAENFL